MQRTHKQTVKPLVSTWNWGYSHRCFIAVQFSEANRSRAHVIFYILIKLSCRIRAGTRAPFGRIPGKCPFWGMSINYKGRNARLSVLDASYFMHIELVPTENGETTVAWETAAVLYRFTVIGVSSKRTRIFCLCAT